MKTKSKPGKAKVPTAADLRILAAGAQAAAKRAKADKANVKSAKKTFKLAKLALKQSRMQAKASTRLAKQSKKAYKAALADQPKAGKKRRAAGGKIAKAARTKAVPSHARKPSRPARKRSLTQRMHRAPRITRPTMDTADQPVIPLATPASAPVEVMRPVTQPPESTEDSGSGRPPVSGVIL